LITRREFYELSWINFQRDPYLFGSIWNAYRDSVDERIGGRCHGALRVLICIGEPGCAWFRVIPQALELCEDARFDVRVTTVTHRIDVAWADVVWVQRSKEASGLQILEMARGMRKLTIFEIDDDFEHVPPENPTYDYVRRGPAAIVRQCLETADVGAFSTLPLACVYQPYCSTQVLWPNVVDPDMWPMLPTIRDDESVIVGFSGSPTHNEDLRMIEPVLADLMNEHRDLWFAHSGVWPGSVQLSLPHDRVLQFAIDMGPPYLSRITRMFDVGLAPLTDNIFNRSKSGLRLLEHSWCYVPTVASDSPPYSDTGIPCRLASTQEEWFRYLNELVSDGGARLTMRVAARKHVEEHCLISQNIWRWKHVLLECAG
jgi:processive 1,2-diacylglycerol beta-glucosyltransferase